MLRRDPRAVGAGAAAQPGQRARASRRRARALPGSAARGRVRHRVPPDAPAARVHLRGAAGVGDRATASRRYGFHGTSHAFVVAPRRAPAGSRAGGREPDRAAPRQRRQRDRGRRAARSVDTSMGLTPLEGLVMGTRCGDIDPALVFHLHAHGGPRGRRDRAGAELRQRDEGARRGERPARGPRAHGRRRRRRRARPRRSTATASASTSARTSPSSGASDAVVFTAGVGENDPVVRARALEGLEQLGIRVAEDRNLAVSAEARAISPPDAAVSVLVVPTDEELEMAEQAAAVGRPALGRLLGRRGALGREHHRHVLHGHAVEPDLALDRRSHPAGTRLNPVETRGHCPMVVPAERPFIGREGAGPRWICGIPARRRTTPLVLSQVGVRGILAACAVRRSARWTSG